AGVKTLVVGFSGDVAAGPGRVTNDNIARAGGTDRGSDGVSPFAYNATSEADLLAAIQEAIYDAAKGSYATSPPAASSGMQLQGKITVGSYALDSRVDFPSWKGHLIAYDTSASSPTMVWDAAVQLANMGWKTRRVYTSDATNKLVMVQVNSDGSIANKSALHTLGLGATDDEAERIARWMLGDPTQGNPAVLGAMTNSTPIDVGQPGADLNPGGIDFSNRYKDRPHVTYVGSDDGMLHAFYTQAAVIGGATKPAGSEAFAYLPPEMLSTVTKLYAQGGQVPDPSSHIFGLASSPKVKNLCAANCTDNASAVWKTVLAMTDGYGGNETFMLDITDPTASSPFSLIWHSATSASSSTYDTVLGQTISVPAFFYSDTPSLDDYRVLFTSGYPVTPAKANDQGHYIVSASAATGQILSQAKISSVGSCGTAPELTMLTDVGTARDYQLKNQLLSGYAGDTWGNLWRFTLTGTPSAVINLGCKHPLHFAPTVVQLDRDDVTNLPHQIYLVQSTNSPLDDVTKDFEPSHLVITRDIFKDGAVSADQTFGVNGTVTLTVAISPQLCGISDLAGTLCQVQLPATARPLGTPLAILKQDGSGFLILSNWYSPDPKGCSKGTTYLQIHQVSVPSGVVTMKQALQVSDEPVSSPIVAGNKIVIITSTGPMVLSGNVTQTFVAGQSSPTLTGAAAEPFKILGWSESF
ncbi:MAG TPA: PilC/PilY family type IV pilus protein, partial [Polyangia bacterium]|nr:PilC/PilY family type IV pilus protein [Polyangia bacterium]